MDPGRGTPCGRAVQVLHGSLHSARFCRGRMLRLPRRVLVLPPALHPPTTQLTLVGSHMPSMTMLERHNSPVARGVVSALVLRCCGADSAQRQAASRPDSSHHRALDHVCPSIVCVAKDRGCSGGEDARGVGLTASSRWRPAGLPCLPFEQPCLPGSATRGARLHVRDWVKSSAR